MQKSESISRYLATLASKPGVYRYYDDNDELLYVGKARNLKARVSSYFRGEHEHPKVRALVRRIVKIDATITATEREALLLEHNLIKEHKPPYNVLLRDDKSYPYLLLTSGQFPRLVVHRGPKKAKGRYFGPYPNTKSVRKTLSLLQKIFMIRHCNDSFFKSRKRPCLQYDIKRCSAPCVAAIDEEAYADQVKRAALVLQGRDDQVIQELIKAMKTASDDLAYEKAKHYRDLVTAVQCLRTTQSAVTKQGNIDVIAMAEESLQTCLVIMMIRQGRLLGHKTFYPKIAHELDRDEMLRQFVCQTYLDQDDSDELPNDIIVSKASNDWALIEDLLYDQHHKKISISHPRRKKQQQAWLAMATENAEHALKQKLSEKNSLFAQFESLAHALKLEVIPERIECFDISHMQGEKTVGACVVCGVSGPIKKAYRRYNVTGVTPGDDYGALYDVLGRHYGKIKKNNGEMPDIILIDGGKGQLAQCEKILAEYQLTDVTVLSISKGPGRKAEFDTVHWAGRKQPLALSHDSTALHLLQFVRDEAHRFAVTGHRKQRDKRRLTSVLEQIPGIGAAKRQALLTHFGGIDGVKTASVSDLAKSPGIGPKLAQVIADALTNRD